jgi:hypothetical protein
VARGLQADHGSRPICNLFKGEPLATLWRDAKAADATLKLQTWCEVRHHLFTVHKFGDHFNDSTVHLRPHDDQMIHIGNIHPDSTADDLQLLFSPFGDVWRCRMRASGDSEPQSATATIAFADAKTVLKAASCPAITLDGRELAVTKILGRDFAPLSSQSAGSLVRDVRVALRLCISETMSVSQLGGQFSSRLPEGQKMTEWCASRPELLELLPAPLGGRDRQLRVRLRAGSKAASKRTLCTNYTEGRCLRGDDCHRKHDPPGIEQQVRAEARACAPTIEQCAPTIEQRLGRALTPAGHPRRASPLGAAAAGDSTLVHALEHFLSDTKN